MTGEHFKEYLYTITLTTKSDKRDICRHLNVSRVTLNKWLRYGLPDKKKFLVLGKLKDYLFDRMMQGESA